MQAYAASCANFLWPFVLYARRGQYRRQQRPCLETEPQQVAILPASRYALFRRAVGTGKILLFTLLTRRDTIRPSFIEGNMRKFLILFLLVSTTIIVGCTVSAFSNRSSYVDSLDSKTPAIIPERPVVFG